jgi:hypothetical protein
MKANVTQRKLTWTEFPTRTFAQLEADFGIVNCYEAQGNNLTSSTSLTTFQDKHKQSNFLFFN